jgi:hypothetical protein
MAKCESGGFFPAHRHDVGYFVAYSHHSFSPGNDPPGGAAAAGALALAAFLGAKPDGRVRMNVYGKHMAQGWRGVIEIEGSARAAVLDATDLRAVARQMVLLADAFERKPFA